MHGWLLGPSEFILVAGHSQDVLENNHNSMKYYKIMFYPQRRNLSPEHNATYDLELLTSNDDDDDDGLLLAKVMKPSGR